MRQIIDEDDIEQKKDSYLDKIQKLIPGETVAVYLPAIAVVETFEPETFGTWGLGVIVLGFIFTLIYIYDRLEKGKKEYTQPVLTGLSFLVWAYGLGYPFTYTAGYLKAKASIILLFYVALSPYIWKYTPKYPKEG